MTEERDVSEAFAEQLRQAKPYAIALSLGLLALFALMVVVGLVMGSKSGFTVILLLTVALLAALGRPLMRASKCPACERFMGRDVGNFCPICGARLRVQRDES